MRTSLAIRAVIVLAGVALVFAPGRLSGEPVAITAIGTLLAALAPAEAGSLLASAGLVAGWLEAYGFGAGPPVVRIVLAALGLYVLHVATALAASIPARADVPAEALVPFLRRALGALGVASGFAGVDLVLPRAYGSPVVELAGLFGAAAVVGSVSYLVLVRRAA